MDANWLPKLAFIGLICLVLILPMFRITELIAEREARQKEAEAEIQEAWSGAQLVGGPVLKISRARSGEILYLLPESLEIQTHLTPHLRHRGLFETVVYTARITLRGHFQPPEPSRFQRPPEEFLWQDTSLSFGLSELRGLRESPRLSFADEAVELEVATETSLFPQAVSARGLDAMALAQGGTTPFELTLLINGSGSLELLPLGRETRLTMTSSWTDPSFRGAFLPASHEIGPDGFTAEWSVPRFARRYPQAWIAGGPIGKELGRAITASAFGTELLMAVDFYQLVSRCTKYAALFITLTFATFFLFEILAGLRIHPVQYLMVGFAMCLFYLLLLAVAEHLGFAPAYLAAASATVALISGYSATVLGTRGRAAILTGALGVLYAVLYVLVQLQTYTLLVGSAGLFVALAMAMYLTRNVDWYGLGHGEPPKPPEDWPQVSGAGEEPVPEAS